MHKVKSNRPRNARGVLALAAAILVCVVGLSCAGPTVSSDVPGQPTQQDDVTIESEPNTPPEIVSVDVAGDRISPSEVCEVICDAVDPDGDELTYMWESPVGQILGSGPAVQWSAPDDEGLFRVTVTVDDGREGVVEQSVSMRVKANLPPGIAEMSADLDWVSTGKPVYFSCATTDADGDEVSHEWEASGGEFFGTGTGVVWLAPEEEGEYWITVWARDAYGGEAKRTMPMRVAYFEPPHLGRFRVKGSNPDLLAPAGDAWKIMKGNTCTIKCVVTEGDGPFTYEWSSSRGTLTSEGELATWHAPQERSAVDIVVHVTDVHGATATGSILIYVETCGCAF